jgi:hypothetical protein
VKFKLSDLRSGHHPIDDVGGATSTSTGSPPITQIIFPACRAQYTGGPNRCSSVSSPFARPSPVNGLVGIHNFTFRGLLRLHSRYGLQGRSPPYGELLSRGFDPASCRPSRSVATMSYRQLHRWILAPLMICALGRTVNRLTPFRNHEYIARLAYLKEVRLAPHTTRKPSLGIFRQLKDGIAYSLIKTIDSDSAFATR